MTGPANDRPRGFRRHPKPAPDQGDSERDRPDESGGRNERRAEPHGRRQGPGRGERDTDPRRNVPPSGPERGDSRARSGGRPGSPSSGKEPGQRRDRPGSRRADERGRDSAVGDTRGGRGEGRGKTVDRGQSSGGGRRQGQDGRGGSGSGERVGGTGDRGGARRADDRNEPRGVEGSRGAPRRGAGRGAEAGDGRRRGPEPGKRNRSEERAAGSGGRSAGRRDTPARVLADPARQAALETLRAVRERDAYANLVLPGLLRDYGVEGRDAALATELGYGACRALGVLDAVIAECAGRGIEEIDGTLLDILRLGTYQLLRTRVEPHAAVHTSVEFARIESGSGRAGFVNAVLRRVAGRKPEEWIEQLAPREPIGRLAFEYAHPVWIAQAFADALGADAGELRELLAADDARPVVHLVARPGDITAEELALVTGGEEGRWSPYAVYLDSGGDPGALEPVKQEMAAVQDEGSQLVALALTRAPLHGDDGGRWLDLCAGPGGKAALLGALAGIDGYQVDAVEQAPHRAELVRNATRGLPVRVHIADGRDSGLTGGYDRVLVDAPCTGLGALRRRPEARWRRTPEDLADLVTLQRELLGAAWDLVRPGGVVIYSTCSPHLPETVAVVADTVRRTGAEQLDARPLLPGVTGIGDGPGVQLWPHRHGTDAMFVAALRKPV